MKKDKANFYREGRNEVISSSATNPTMKNDIQKKEVRKTAVSIESFRHDSHPD